MPTNITPLCWILFGHDVCDVYLNLEAIIAAYGWKSDLSDEEILEKLLSLNFERAKN